MKYLKNHICCLLLFKKKSFLMSQSSVLSGVS